jgi:hypothetical protein
MFEIVNCPKCNGVGTIYHSTPIEPFPIGTLCYFGNVRGVRKSLKMKFNGMKDMMFKDEYNHRWSSCEPVEEV